MTLCRPLLAARRTTPPGERPCRRIEGKLSEVLANYPFEAYLLRCLLPTHRAHYHRELSAEHFPSAAALRRCFSNYSHEMSTYEVLRERESRLSARPPLIAIIIKT